MGSIRKDLARFELKAREDHHSRLFVDLAENIHIHHREYRTVFSLNEFFEYVDVINKSVQDVMSYLENNKDYEEAVYPTTIMIGGGKSQQLRPIMNSPKANKSAYYDDEFAIELQDTFVTDEIHFHYRDFRLALSVEAFRIVASGFREALDRLESFEKTHTLAREDHPDRAPSGKDETRFAIPGVKRVQLRAIKSNWYADIMKEFKPNKKWIKLLNDHVRSGNQTEPILLSTEKNGNNLIVDGHHRYYSAVKMNLTEIDAIVLPYTFAETKPLRDAENCLKTFDKNTNYQESMTGLFKTYSAHKLNKFYRNDFKRRRLMGTIWWKSLLRIKQAIFGKRKIFKSFYEAHNDHA